MDAVIRVQRILWAALVASTFMYLGVLQVVQRPAAAPSFALFAGIAGAAVMSAAMSVVVPDLLGAASLRRAAGGLVRTRGDFHPDAMPNPRDAGLTATVIDNPDAVIAAAMPAAQTRFILGMALSESVALFGFVLTFLGFPAAWTIGFFAASWALMAMRFPRPEAITRWIESVLGVKFPEGLS